MINLKTIVEQIYNRSDMPQVAGDDLGDAYKLMKENGIPVEVVTELPKNLKHSQKQINKSKVKSIIIDKRAGKKMPPLVISKDNWIVDGHHRQVAYMVEDPNEEKTMIKIGYPRDKAIGIYKKVENKL